MSNMIVDQQVRELKKTSSMIKQYTKEIQPSNKIDEDFFVEYYIPLFAGDIKDREEIDQRVAGWITLCGSAYSSITIVKQNGESFIFPPLYDLSEIKPRTVRQGLTIDAKMQEVDNLSNVNPLAANKKASELMKSTLDVIRPKGKFKLNEKIKEIVAMYRDPKSKEDNKPKKPQLVYSYGSDSDY